MATHVATISESIVDFFVGAKRDARVRVERRDEVRRSFDEMRGRVRSYADDMYEASQAVRAEKYISSKLLELKSIRERTAQNQDAARAKRSWWQLMVDAPPVDFTDLDTCIAKLESGLEKIRTSGEIEAARAHFQASSVRALSRIDRAEADTLLSVPASRRSWYDGNQVSNASLWLSAASVPVSAWGDVSVAGDIYTTLREVNGNFAAMTDAEIWMQSLALPAESLAGLVSLTKGAYFESLVAEGTGRALFPEFNHPDTDIVIDGIAYQLKATDSVDYINTVPDHIQVISTSEVALASGSIDSGIALTEVERATELALGGTIFDLGDTAFDAVLTGVGALGLFSTLRGVNHALRSYASSEKNGIDAIAGGVGVAVVGTAKSFVDTAEMGYKVVTSRPSIFAGRQAVNLLKWTGKKIAGRPELHLATVTVTIEPTAVQKPGPRPDRIDGEATLPCQMNLRAPI